MSDDTREGNENAAADQPTSAEEIDASEKADGLGTDGTIPAHPGGVAAGYDGEQSSFEPEEDAGQA